MSVRYRIEVVKDGASITARFDVRVNDIASPELLSAFHLNVEGQNLVADFQPGQKQFIGTRSSILKNPAQDCPVTFDISSNRPWSDDGSDTLRGSKLRDDSTFEN
jgi:hypothetical protein